MFHFNQEIGKNVAEQDLSLSVSMEWWHRYQSLLQRAITPLTDEQLTYRLGTQRSAGEIIAHIVAVRAWYLHGVMGEGGPEMDVMMAWDTQGAPPRTSAELLTGIDQTWALLTGRLGRWTDADMQTHFFINWLGHEEPRGWVVWHLIEHEIHHGGELSFTLGSYGLPGVDV
jgi:uncharacterized damage-inducible protein DinB